MNYCGGMWNIRVVKFQYVSLAAWCWPMNIHDAVQAVAAEALRNVSQVLRGVGAAHARVSSCASARRAGFMGCFGP
jgi:hypothetical protein